MKLLLAFTAALAFALMPSVAPAQDMSAKYPILAEDGTPVNTTTTTVKVGTYLCAEDPDACPPTAPDTGATDVPEPEQTVDPHDLPTQYADPFPEIDPSELDPSNLEEDRPDDREQWDEDDMRPYEEPDPDYQEQEPEYPY